MLGRFLLPTPDGLHNTNLDNIAADSLPLLTMLACVPSLRLFARHRRHADLVESMLPYTVLMGDANTLSRTGCALPMEPVVLQAFRQYTSCQRVLTGVLQFPLLCRFFTASASS